MTTKMTSTLRFPIISICIIAACCLEIQGRYIATKDVLRKHMPFKDHLVFVEETKCEEKPKLKFFQSSKLKVLHDKLSEMGQLTKINGVFPEGTYLQRCDPNPSCYHSRHFSSCRPEVMEIVTLEFATLTDSGEEEIFQVEAKNHVTCTCGD